MRRTAGFFTGIARDQYKLPHPRLGLPVFLLIRRVLCHAFDVLREQDIDLATASEDELTMFLESVIFNDLWRSGCVTGFDHRSFHPPTRQGEIANHDMTKMAKKPDLCFRLQHDDIESRAVLPEFDALFVECKPVDTNHPVGAKYCNDGLNRFVNGEYAWAMQEGLMLAYVRDGKTIAKDLLPAIQVEKRMKSLCVIQIPQPLEVDGRSANCRAQPIHVSKHRRDFEWKDGKGPATDITVYHFWHDCNAASDETP